MSNPAERAEKLTDALRESGIRLTRQRRLLLDIVSRSDDHPDAVELHRRATDQMPGISLSTVYRTLSALEEHGVVQRHQFQNDTARFEPADGAHHDHMIDLDSGEVVEFHSDQIERLQSELAAEAGYEIVAHRMELYVRKIDKEG
ncbi:Fur family transcriptional regulator, ferric uptake regulator [Palleronia marisminoris]|uniref:Ferric uptake regulation protein n=1 Tax=Palleronia marisminoris TaxID=315423 RepID=A0A1Y5RTY4_9RHOB|nr:transcriptional repressor [Palleronia marisminoris]SFG48283.1 Fur family transcriptional regulator, ferric uptake regulator [Palleronia marisminoris]SLN25405.1 Ferric uptake regulation protein [Palleronia marisminoris]